MQVKIVDKHDEQDGTHYYWIELYPETNQEMAELERPYSIKFEPKDYIRRANAMERMCYIVGFEETPVKK